MVQSQISPTVQLAIKKKGLTSDTTTHGEEGNVENDEVQGHAQRKSLHEELVLPKRQAKQAFVLRQRVHRVEHFDRDQDRQAHRGRMTRLDAREHIAPDLRKERRTLVEVRLGGVNNLVSDAVFVIVATTTRTNW